MKYVQMSAGMYVVRTRELSWARVLSGAICYVDSVVSKEIHIRITEDCVPKGKVFAIGEEADDGCWYDVSELVMQANSCITPSLSSCAFESSIAPNYRNFLGLGEYIQPLSLHEAVGNICMIGEQVDGNTIFAKSGYFVVASDDNGYAIVYQGYCDYIERDEPRVLTLRVLNLSGTRRNFYQAEGIVSACMKAYREDCELAVTYTQQIHEDTIVSSTDSALSASRGNVCDLELEGAAC